MEKRTKRNIVGIVMRLVGIIIIIPSSIALFFNMMIDGYEKSAEMFVHMWSLFSVSGLLVGAGLMKLANFIDPLPTDEEDSLETVVTEE